MVTRRDFVGFGAGAAAVAMTAPAAAAGVEGAGTARRMPGVHIWALLRVVNPPTDDFPFSVMFALWGPDSSLNGMGWGSTTEGGDTAESYVGGNILPCVFGAHGLVKGDTEIRLDAFPVSSGLRGDQALPWRFKADLASGAIRGVRRNAETGAEVLVVVEGNGMVTRI